MAQLVKLGNYLVEIDGSKLTFFDAAGNPIGKAQDFAETAQVTLPDGQLFPIEELTDLLDDAALANFQTAAGGEAPVPAEVDSGGGRFAAFEGQQGLGGFTGVGGLGSSELTYRTPENDTSREEDGEDDLPPSLAGIFEEEPVIEEPEPEEPELPEPILLAPKVAATDGSVAITLTEITGEQNPLGDQKVGDYLRSGGVNGKAVDPAMVNGVDSRNLTMAEAAEVKVSFVSEGAGNKSMVGFYTFDANGKINPDSVQFLWLDASQAKQNTPGGALQKDFLGNAQPQDISLGQLPADTKFGFFIVSDGASSSANQKLLAGIDGVSKKGDNYVEDLAAINEQVSFKVDANGNGQILVSGQALAGNIYFTHDKTLNTDANKNDMEHTLSGVSAKDDGKLYVGFEDLAGGGDRDYDDVVLSVDIGQYNINKLSQNVTQPVVSFSDADSSHLSAVVITTHGFDATDSLNLPSDARFDVQTQQNGNDVTVTITAKSGAEPIGDFEDFVNHAFFSTSGTVEGDREITYQATDTDGNVSNIESVNVSVSVSEEQIVVTPGDGNTIDPGTDDVLHLNVQAMGKHYDLGAGYDTVQLGKGNMDFGSDEAQYLKNIEEIDAKGAGHNNITLSFEDVIDMTDETNHLTIVGQKGDNLNLTGDGTHNWSVVDQGADFTTYAYNDGVNQAMVEVSNQMAQTVV